MGADMDRVRALQKFLGDLFRHVHPVDLFIDDSDLPETPEERRERKAKQAELFRRLEIERGIGARASQKVLDDVVKAWGGYLRYMGARVVQLQMGEGNKITAEEIEDAFQNYLHEYYEFVEIDGCEVYFNRSEIDLDRKDYRGLTNKELMELGRAPIGADGKPMNLHHLTRRHPGALVLMTETFHQENTSLLHLRNTKYMRQPGPVDRLEFDH